MDILSVLRAFGLVIVEFLGELLLINARLFPIFSRRDRFPLRISLSGLGVLLVAFALSFLYVLWGDRLYGRILVYATLFAAVYAMERISFEETPVTILFTLSMAYALQNIMYNLWVFLYVIFQWSGFADLWGNNGTIYRLLYYSYIALFLFVSNLIFLRHIVKTLKERNFSRKMVQITVLVLISTIVLCSSLDICFASLSSVRENHFDSTLLYFLRESSVLMNVLCGILVLFLGSRSVSENNLIREVEYLEHSIRQAKKQYEISKETIDLINVKCHDIKYQISALAHSGEITPDSVLKLSESVKIYDSLFDTGNKLLDVLLMEKTAYCNSHGITLSCLLDGENLLFMDSGDLYCLFGNLIDNAIEAVMKIDEPEKRIIRLSVNRRGNIVFIEEDNYYSGEILFEDGLPKTTKGDASFHGFGTKSIRAIVRGNGGEYSATTKDGIFSLSIVLIDQNQAKKPQLG